MNNYTNLDFLRFLLFDVHPVKRLFSYQKFAHLDEEQCWMMLDIASKFADQEMFPFYKEMDHEPATYDGNGGVKTHPQLKRIIQMAAEQGWIGGSAKFEHGGLQLPEMIFNAGQHIFQAANNSVQGYLGLSSGAAGLITSFGSQEQIDTYVPHIFEGRWQGTMALTEPQAGSSLSDISTTAKPSNENHYFITGQKIFISGGQHEAVNNFVHLTLARIAGAPAGVKGISLFIIPKFRPQSDDTLTYNDVQCVGDFQKMGQKGYSTTQLSFGDNNDCRGWLVGEANQGLKYMFQMMNGARISVGQCAASVAMAAYQASLQYCLERPQGRKPSEKDPTKPPIQIIHHADIQRMLLTQKSIVEGSLSLAMECNLLYDLYHAAEGDEKKQHLALLEILTPIIKTYASEQGCRSAALAIQTLGGYGFTTDFPVQQMYRDLKIMTLYEGTTGIQSIDLLARKLIMDNGRAWKLLLETIQIDIVLAEKHLAITEYAIQLNMCIQTNEIALKTLQQYLPNEIDRYLSDATVFMEMVSYLVIGWQWLKMAIIALDHLDRANESTQTKLFYEGKIHTMKFYFKYELPHLNACAETLINPNSLTNLNTFDYFN